MKRLVTLLLVLSILFIACSEDDDDDGYDFTTDIFALFTNPNGSENVQSEAVNYIQNAEKTIAVATFLLEDDDIENSLIDAHERGILVRVVCDQENYAIDEEGCYGRLEDGGIEISVDPRGGSSSHNKTMIIDSSIVWTGCTNFTYSGLFSNNNSALIMNSREIALEYLHDFQQMFDGRFQSNKTSNGVEEYTIDGSAVQVYFTPVDGVENMLRERVQMAEESIDLAIYAYTLNYITDDYIDAHNRGVEIRVIFDSLAIERGYNTKYNDFVRAGIDARKDPCRYAFHHKFMIIDGDELIVSSGNYTMSGTNYNDENFVWIQDGDIIDYYTQEFEKWWQETESYNLK
ncbi:MAG: phospholipase D-like domain-containing protein [Candidatus Zixiibacteriota bacterium]